MDLLDPNLGELILMRVGALFDGHELDTSASASHPDVRSAAGPARRYSISTATSTSGR